MIKIHDRVYMVGGYGFSRPEDCLVYLVKGDGAMALIDCGAGKSVNAILRNINALGMDENQVKYVIATHGHIDHIGGLAQLKQKGIKVVAHQKDEEAIAQNNPKLNAADMYGTRYQPVEIDQVVDGETGELDLGGVTVQMLHTPGHTPGSMVAYLDLDGQRILFGQDIHGPFSSSWRSNIKQWRDSMQKVIGLQADILCEGHFGVIEGKKKVEDFIKSHLRANPG
ncbi:MAG: MBL fold metallo-hydrolase [Firmicutes bacterium]|nr:MBL fold metallo-hydrolase [Bacillota bacterium]